MSLALLSVLFALLTTPACGPLRFAELDGGPSIADASPGLDAGDAASESPRDTGVSIGADAGATDAAADLTFVASMGPQRLAGVLVLIHDARGELVSSLVTSVDGTASHPWVEGGYATMGFVDTENHALLSTLKLWRPGATVVFDLSAFAQGRPIGSVRVPPLPAHAGAREYTVRFGCTEAATATTGPGVDVALSDACINDRDEVRALALALDAQRSSIAYWWSEPVMPTSAVTTDLRFLGTWSETATTCTLTAANAPQGATAIDFGCSPIVAGVEYDLPRATSSIEPGSTAELRYLGVEGEQLRSSVEVRFGASIQDNASGIYELLRAPLGGPAEVTADLGGALLPRVLNATFERTAGPRIFWSTEAPTSEDGADALLAVVAAPQSLWMFMLPAYAQPPLLLPELPAPLALYEPLTAETWAVFVDSIETRDYGALADRHGMVSLVAPHLRIPPTTMGRASAFGQRCDIFR